MWIASLLLGLTAWAAPLIARIRKPAHRGWSLAVSFLCCALALLLQLLEVWQRVRQMDWSGLSDTVDMLVWPALVLVTGVFVFNLLSLIPWKWPAGLPDWEASPQQQLTLTLGLQGAVFLLAVLFFLFWEGSGRYNSSEIAPVLSLTAHALTLPAAVAALVLWRGRLSWTAPLGFALFPLALYLLIRITAISERLPYDWDALTRPMCETYSLPWGIVTLLLWAALWLFRFLRAKRRKSPPDPENA